MNRILVICSSFPPINATAIHRTLALVRRLAARNFDVLILTMKPDESVKIDEKLMDKVPNSVRIVRFSNVGFVELLKKVIFVGRRAEESDNSVQKSGGGGEAIGANCDVSNNARGGEANGVSCGAPNSSRGDDANNSRGGIFSAVKDWLCQWLQFPDNRLGWCINSALRGIGPVLAFKPDMIYSSAPMWSSHLLGMFFSVLLRKRWVADCRDPWRGNPYRNFKFKSHNSMDALLERLMVKRASAVIANTPALCRDFGDRYPAVIWKFFTVTNGYDAAAIEAVTSSRVHRNGICRLVHAGSFYGQRRPQPYFDAIAQAVKENPTLRAKLRLKQVGEDHYDGSKLMDIADHYGVADMLELTPPVAHHQALMEIYKGDVAVAASQDGQNCDLQIPRKFYEYFGLQKAMLITGGCCKAIKGLLGDCDTDKAGIYLVPKIDAPVLKNVILDIYEKWRQGLLVNPKLPKVDLTEDRMARQIESVMHMAMEM